MAITTSAKRYVNSWLKHLNLRIDTLTVDRIEEHRLALLDQQGQFEQPQFEVPPQLSHAGSDRLFAALGKYKDRFRDLQDPTANPVSYGFDQIWYSSPDAEVLYTVVREYQPRTIVEIGSGNSTKVSRLAILDGRLDTRLVSVDPNPRNDVKPFVDEFYGQRVETVQSKALLTGLQPNDILFIDSSHEVKTGSDVVFLFLNIIPQLAPGVLIHIHDIFLPYDYPKEWVVKEKWGFTEQYIVQCLLMATNDYEVLWAGHYLQRTKPTFAEYFPHLRGRMAKSLWLRKAG